jgi:elongation factor G
LVQAIRDRKLFPILCGAPARNVGVTPLLDLVVEAFPSPLDRPPVEGKDAKGNPVRCEAKDGAPLTALVFKTIADPFAGKVTMFRIYAGTMTSDSSVLNVSKGARERIGQLLLLRGKQQTAVEALGAGDIGAVVKLKETGTGDTLCDEKAPVRLPEISFPAPVISFAVEPKAKGDEDKMSAAFTRLEDDHRFVSIPRPGDGRVRDGASPRRDRRRAVEAEVRRGRDAENAAGSYKGDDQGGCGRCRRHKQTGGRTVATAGSTWAMPRAAASSSPTRSWAAPSRGTSSRRSKRGSWRPWSAAPSPAIRWWTSR